MPRKREATKIDRWTKEKRELMLQLVLDGTPWQRIGFCLGRSVSAAKVEWHRMRKTDERAKAVPVMKGGRKKHIQWGFKGEITQPPPNIPIRSYIDEQGRTVNVYPPAILVGAESLRVTARPRGNH